MSDFISQLHFVCGLVTFFFLSYYLLMFSYFKGRTEKRIGLHISYAYHPVFLVFSGLLYYLFLVFSLYLSLFFSFSFLAGVGLSLLLLVLHVFLFGFFRNLFCIICLYREGILVAYFDGRREQFLFAELEKMQSGRFSRLCFLYLKNGRRFFLCAPFLGNYRDLVRNLRERLLFFEFAEKYSD